MLLCPSLSNLSQMAYINPGIKTHYTFLEKMLETCPEGGDWFCGKQLTGADILLSFPLVAAQLRGVLKAEEYPKMTAFIARFQEREAYKRAVAKIESLEGSFKASI